MSKLRLSVFKSVRGHAVFGLACLLAAGAVSADILVWKSGVRIEIKETLEALKGLTGTNLHATILDSQAREASVWLKRNDIDWGRSRLATDALAAFGSSGLSTVGGASAQQSSSRALLPPEARAPGVIAYEITGHSVYGHALIKGIIRNNSDVPVKNLKVKVFLLNYKKEAQATGWGKPKPAVDVLHPGETVPFEAMLLSTTVWSTRHFKAEVFFDPVGTAPPESGK